MTDEIMAEVRRIRDAYVAKHNRDLDAVFADLKQRESASPGRFVDLAAQRKESRRD